MKIRKLRVDDIEAAAKIVGLNYSKKYQRLAQREMEAMFGDNVSQPKYLVAEDKGKILGAAGYIQSWMDYDFYHIFWVNIDPKYQRQGIGRALVARVIKAIKKKAVGYILLTTSKPKFYTRFGFKPLMKYKKKNQLMVLKLNKKSK